MRVSTKTRSRRGATLVECAIVYPATFLILLGLVIGGMGIFRYQEVSSLAREASRYAATHGAQYRKDAGLATGTASDWQTDIYNTAVLPRVVSLDTSNLSMNAAWPSIINLPDKSDNWPGSTVTVTVSYIWLPELYFTGPIKLSSTSYAQISN